jgi:hypothetical protein
MKFGPGAIVSLILGLGAIVGSIFGAGVAIERNLARIEALEKHLGTLQDRVDDLDGFAAYTSQELRPIRNARSIRTKGRDVQ